MAGDSTNFDFLSFDCSHFGVAIGGQQDSDGHHGRLVQAIAAMLCSYSDSVLLCPQFLTWDFCDLGLAIVTPVKPKPQLTEIIVAVTQRRCSDFVSDENHRPFALIAAVLGSPVLELLS